MPPRKLVQDEIDQGITRAGARDRLAAHGEIQKVLHAVGGHDYEAVPFGSHAMRLDSRNSDIDIGVRIYQVSPVELHGVGGWQNCIIAFCG